MCIGQAGNIIDVETWAGPAGLAAVGSVVGEADTGT